MEEDEVWNPVWTFIKGMLSEHLESRRALTGDAPCGKGTGRHADRGKDRYFVLGFVLCDEGLFGVE